MASVSGTAAAPPARKIGGKTAVVTGGSQGVGKALARLLAQSGYNVVLAARQPERLQAAAAECAAIRGGDEAALAMPCDITRAADVEALAAAVQARYERVDLVVNNAGVCLRGSLADTSLEDYAEQMQVNFMGAVAVTKAFLSPLRAAAAVPLPGAPAPALAVVNSFGGRMPIKDMSAYCASKFALAGWVDSIRGELGSYGVHVAHVHPGVIASDFMERAQFRGASGDAAEAQMRSMLGSGLPLVQTPEQVAAAVMDAVKAGRREAMVGAPFKAIYATYNATGINPFTL